MARSKPFGKSGLPSGQIQPFLIAMLMPDFVISLALPFLASTAVADLGWQGTTFGTWGSQVQILPLRPILS
jgi:hypothetical protein